MNNDFPERFFDRIIPFFKKYGIFIAPLLLFLFFMLLLIFSYARSPRQSTPVTASPTQSPSQTENSTSYSPSQETVSISPSQTPSGGMESDERKDQIIWSNISLSDSDFDGLNATKTTLSDGSTEYSYDSGVPNRPNIIIEKNGINVYQQTPFTDTPLSQDTNYYGQPDYTAKGSQFWGANAITYIYLSKGVALVGDPNKDQMFEEIVFQPGTITQFEQEDTDMTSPPQKP